jgi:hypothetical protein
LIEEEAYDQKEKDSQGFGYFWEPKLVAGLWDENDPQKQKKIDSVYAAGHYSIVLEKPVDSVSN